MLPKGSEGKLEEEEKGDGMFEAEKPRKTTKKRKVKGANRCSGLLSKFGAFLWGGRGGRRTGTKVGSAPGPVRVARGLGVETRNYSRPLRIYPYR